jgi:DNA invertase Pin-like site-specific DNA recombinase
VVWKFDRLARSVRQLIDTMDALREKGVVFRSLTEAVETTTPQRPLVFQMFGALAEFERSLIRERTLAGLAAARREGRIGGRRRKMLPSDIEAARELLADPNLRVAVIARRLGVSVRTFYRYVPAPRCRTGVRLERPRREAECRRAPLARRRLVPGSHEANELDQSARTSISVALSAQGDITLRDLESIDA